MGADQEHGTHNDDVHDHIHIHEHIHHINVSYRMHNDELSATRRESYVLQENADRLSSLPDVIGGLQPCGQVGELRPPGRWSF